MIITLLDGRQVDASNIFFDDSDYSFKLGGTAEDLTTLIKQADKKTFSGFDVSVYNDIVYAQHYFAQHGSWPPSVGSTSVWVNFVQQITTDPFAAPLDSLSSAISSAVDSDGFKKILIVGFIALGVLLLVKD